jgi:serine/threonine-protein kinase
MTLIGNKIRHFSIVSALGRGGMGDVYAGYDENLKRKVAIKAIQAGRGLTPLEKARFLREAQILSQLDHPGICRIHDYIEFEGRDYLILELIEGQTLSSAQEDLDSGTKLDIAIQIAQVLDMAHGEGVVHRDLKPDNVMLTPGDQVKLLDFGLARSLDEEEEEHDPESLGPEISDPVQDRTIALRVDTTMPGTILGTPLFMSPEQARSESVSPASDMYSFGLLLQWLFTGSSAYEMPDDVQSMLEMARQARTRPARGIDHDLAALIERLKSPSPARRPTALAAGERLAWIRRKPARRNRRLVVAAALIAVLLTGFKYTTDLQRERQRAEQNRSQAEDLMGFMLGDLRDKLEPVGRLDVLDDVGRKALEYYASRREEGLKDEEYFRLSQAMVQIGDVRMAQGDMEAARQAFAEALVSAKELVRRDPENPEWLAGLGAVHFWLGSIEYSQGNLDEAESRFVTYLEVAQRWPPWPRSAATW